MKYLAAIALLLCTSLASHADEPLAVGSKTFTESVVLGEIATLAAREAGYPVQHRRSLGGTRIVWRALLEGEIDAYPEYTGTLSREILQLPDADFAALRQALAERGLAMTEPLGFNNTYALGMRAEQADRLGIDAISDLRGHSGLRFGFSNEFMDRADGWPGLREAYGLSGAQGNGLDHSLAYHGLVDGALDVIDLYRTDAEIARYHLRVLEDDRHYFPRYDAVFIYRADLRQRAPQWVSALEHLAGQFDADTMRRLNARVSIDGVSESKAAADWYGVDAAIALDRGQRIVRRTLEHLRLVAISLAMALLIALPLGVWAARHPRWQQWVLSATGLLQTLPSLAVFVFMIPLFGIGAKPAIAALFLYSLLPIVRNTHAGIVGIAPELRETAAAIGLSRSAQLYRVELPLALRSILAGVKTAAVINVGTATLGALIGAGGYGQPILTGIRLDNIGLILEGAIPAAVLALLVQGLFELIERALTPRGLRLLARE